MEKKKERKKNQKKKVGRGVPCGTAPYVVCPTRLVSVEAGNADQNESNEKRGEKRKKKRKRRKKRTKGTDRVTHRPVSVLRSERGGLAALGCSLALWPQGVARSDEKGSELRRRRAVAPKSNMSRDTVTLHDLISLGAKTAY